MRSLAQPKALMRAGVAGAVTAVLCYPRLTSWFGGNLSVPYVALLLLWSAFVLWLFVFAWHEQYSGGTPLRFSRDARLWGWATLFAVASAILLHFFADPELRKTTPADYPTSLRSWCEMGLFGIAFDPLFLCFAPFAFFIRLSRRVQAAQMLTVCFQVFVLFLKLRSFPALPFFGLTAALMFLRVAGAWLSVFFYVRGGAWVVWWMILVVHSRHLAGLLSGAH